jgi:competence protein ComEC
VSFVVMPCAVLGTIAYPFGLDRPVWWAMGLGVEAVLRLSQWVASLSGSTVTVPAFGAGALLLLALAILGTTIFVSGLRWLAALPAILGLAAAASHPRPDLYVARDGSGAAIRGREGRLVVVGRVPAFTVEQWLRADGDARRASDPSVRAAARCDPVGCTVPLRDGRVVSYVEDRRAFPEDCRRAAAIVSRLVSPDGCAAALVIDRRFLAGHGATAARAGPNGWELATARNPSELRPWLPPRPGAPPAREPDRTRAASETGLDRRGGERPGPSLDPDLPPAESPDWTRPPEFQ